MFLAVVMLITLLIALAVSPGAKAQGTPFQKNGIDGEPFTPTLKAFTNSTAGVGGLHTTNTLTQLTNGSTTVASSWVKLGGRGATLWQELSPTNALLTNIVAEYRFSRDGTNAAAEPVFLWRTATAAIAAGKYTAMTNLAQTYVGECAYIQLWKVHLTNGVNNVGSVFATNGPGFFLQRGS
jgi:hypothetical protein